MPGFAISLLVAYLFFDITPTLVYTCQIDLYSFDRVGAVCSMAVPGVVDMYCDVL